MKREPEFFGDQELVLVYMARSLRKALAVEKILDDAGLDYAVETGPYSSGILFFSHKVGAFFYLLPADEERARALLQENGYKPYRY
ncbi:hypothetical protein EHM92_03335 [bacterium]|nr:MAG: hypothetical protein EHM92_03335 [bacterium]